MKQRKAKLQIKLKVVAIRFALPFPIEAQRKQIKDPTFRNVVRLEQKIAGERIQICLIKIFPLVNFHHYVQ